MSIFSSIGSAISKAYNTVTSTIGSIFNGGTSQTAGVANAVPTSTNPNLGLNYTPVPAGIKKPLSGSVGEYNARFIVSNPQYGYGGSPNPTSLPGFTPIPGTSASPTSYFSGTKTSGSPADYSSLSHSPTGQSGNPLSSLASTSPVSRSVSASDIGAGTTPTVMPSSPTGKNRQGDVIGNNVGLGNADPKTGLIDTTVKDTTPQQTPEEANFEKMMAMIKEPASQIDAYRKAEQESQVIAKRQQLQNTQNAINAVTTQMNTDLLQLRGTAAKEGVTEAVYGGQQNEVTREATIKLLPLQGQLAADQGNLKLAEEHMDTLFGIYSKDAQNSVDYYNANLAKRYEFFTTQQKKKADELLYQKNFVKDAINDQAATQKSVAIELLKAGDTSGYKAVTSIRPPVNMNSPTLDQDLQNYKRDLNAAISKYGGGIAAGNLTYKELSDGSLIALDPKGNIVKTISGGDGGGTTSHNLNTALSFATSNLTKDGRNNAIKTFNNFIANGKTAEAKAYIDKLLIDKLPASQKTEMSTMAAVDKSIDKLAGYNADGKLEGIGGLGKGTISGALDKVFGSSSKEAREVRAIIGNIKGTIALLRGGTSFTTNEQKLLESYVPTINENSTVAMTKVNLLKGLIADKKNEVLYAGNSEFFGNTPSSSTDTPPTGGSVLRSPDGTGEVSVSELTPAELEEAKAAGWK